MIKSKFGGFNFWILLVALTWSIYLYIAVVLKYYFNIKIYTLNIQTPADAHSFLTICGIGILVYSTGFIYRANRICIDTINKSIAIKNIITQKEKFYSFNELD